MRATLTKLSGLVFFAPLYHPRRSSQIVPSQPLRNTRLAFTHFGSAGLLNLVAGALSAGGSNKNQCGKPKILLIGLPDYRESCLISSGFPPLRPY